MTNAPDISKEAVERDICTPIINYVADGRGMSEDTLAGIIDKSRAMVARIAELEAEAATVREKALRDFVDECEVRADMMDGVEMECCRGTAMNCASDAENLIAKDTP